MLFTNLGIMVGVYLGKQVVDNFRSRKAVKNRGKLATAIVTTIEPESKSLHFAKVGGATTILISTASYCCSPLNLIAVGA